VFQGLDPATALNENGTITGNVAVDYDTGVALDYGDYATASGPTAVSPSGVDYSPAEYDYDAVGDPVFLNSDDAWLAKLRQVLFVS
jgi:hypothetical protein